MLLLVLLGCRPEELTVQALVDARAEQLAADAALPTRLALACGGIAAQAAPLSQEAWGELERFVPHAELAEVLQLEPTGVQSHATTGAVKVAWSGVEFSPDLVGRLELDVLRAQNQFRLSLAQTPGEAPGVTGECAASVEEDAGGEPVLHLELELEVGSQDHHVVLPARPDQELDDSGVEIAPPRWAEGGGFLPLEGDFQWSRQVGKQRQSVRGLDVYASDATVEAWPAIAAAEDWEHKLWVDLRRETDDEAQ